MAENTKKLDLTDIDLATFDFRQLYLTDNQLVQWEKWNPLYKAVWFRYKINEKKAEVDKDGPLKCYKYGDIECHPVALAAYTELYKSKKNPIYKYKNNHFTVAKNSALEVSADVMNGWWGPVKLFWGLSDRVNPISTLKSQLKNNNLCGKNLNFEELSKLFSKKVGIGDEKEREAAFNAMLDFLKVVYTIGNFSPIPSSGCFGRIDLDNWACKLYRNMIWGWVGLLESLSYPRALQKQYSRSRMQYFKSHKFSGYFNKTGKPTAYWKIGEHDENDFRKPNNSTEWKIYFEKTTELIENRAIALLDGKEDTIKQNLSKKYRDLFKEYPSKT